MYDQLHVLMKKRFKLIVRCGERDGAVRKGCSKGGYLRHVHAFFKTTARSAAFVTSERESEIGQYVW